MKAEEIALRSEIRQMLNEAGFNRDTIKQLVKEAIDGVVKNQVNQVLMERIEEVVSNYIDSRLYSQIRNCAENVIREKLRWMNFSVNVEVTGQESEG